MNAADLSHTLLSSRFYWHFHPLLLAFEEGLFAHHGKVRGAV